MQVTRRILLQGAAAVAATPLLPAFGAELPKFHYCSAAAVPRAFSGYIFLAEALGFDKILGYSADTTYAAGSGAGVQLMMSKQVDMSNPGILEFVAIKKKTPELATHLVYCQDYESSYVTVVADDSPYKTVADLKGKSVGVLSLGSGAVPTVKAQLRIAGVDPASVQIVAVGADAAAYAAFKTGQVEALSMFIGTIAAMENNGAKFRQFPVKVSSGGFAVTDAFLNANRSLVIKALQGIALSTAVMQLNPRVATEAYYRKYGAPAGDREAALTADAHSVQRTMEVFKHPNDSHKWGELSEQGWADLINFAGPDSGYTVENTKYREFFNPELIDEVNKVDLTPAIDIAKNGLPPA